MNELIPIASRDIAGATVQTVNARDLHAFLEAQTAFKDWIARRIQDFDFIDNLDFCSFLSESSGGRPAKEYALTIGMAKELSMVERNAQGKRARLYFIECERRANATPALPDLSDPVVLVQLLTEHATKRIEAEKRAAVAEKVVEEQAPKVQFHDDVASAVNCQTVEEVAKALGTGRNRFFAFLRETGLLMANNLPYQKYCVDGGAGYFRVIEKTWKDQNGENYNYTQTLVTGKGFSCVQRRCRGAQDRPGQLPLGNLN